MPLLAGWLATTAATMPCDATLVKGERRYKSMRLVPAGVVTRSRVWGEIDVSRIPDSVPRKGRRACEVCAILLWVLYEKLFSPCTHARVPNASDPIPLDGVQDSQDIIIEVLVVVVVRIIGPK
jgi:hypothetical protein